MSLTVLIIEDHQPTAHGLELHLKHLGHRAVSVNSAQAARPFLENTNFDLIICEIRLDADARQIAESMRDFLDPPLMVGMGLPLRDETRRAGSTKWFAHYLEKPFTPIEFDAFVAFIIATRDLRFDEEKS